MNLLFKVKKRAQKPNFDHIRQTALEKIGDLLFEHLFILTSGVRGGEELGIKTGRLRRSLRVEVQGSTVTAFFDPQVAGDSIFAIYNLQKKGINILQKALDDTQQDPKFQEILKETLNAFR